MNPRFLSKLLLAFASLSGLACSSSDHNDGSVGQVPCTGVTNCRSTATAPVCGDTTSAQCDMNLPNPNPPYGYGLCVYRVIHNLSSCICIDGQLQYCSTGAGGGGETLIQDCVKTGAQAASWGGCHG